jgi:hypothetical protein
VRPGVLIGTVRMRQLVRRLPVHRYGQERQAHDDQHEETYALCFLAVVVGRGCAGVRSTFSLHQADGRWRPDAGTTSSRMKFVRLVHPLVGSSAAGYAVYEDEGGRRHGLIGLRGPHYAA